MFGLFPKKMGYFDHLRPGEKFGKIQDGVCEDEKCPCGLYGTRILRGNGYLIIPEAVVRFRVQARSLDAVEKKLAGIRDPTVKVRLKPLLVCERSYLLRDVDRDVAAADARHWWQTRQVPLRPTPTAGLGAGVYRTHQKSPGKQNGALKDALWEQRAFEFAKKKHNGQSDDYGRPVFDNHILQVVKILKIVTSDREIIAAGYLHDTVEKTSTNLAELEKFFGPRVSRFVMEVTREGHKAQGSASFPRLRSREAVLIKFADRLSNLSRIEGWDEARQQRYLKESQFWSSHPSGENPRP
jgi:hypothetical protein